MCYICSVQGKNMTAYHQMNKKKIPVYLDQKLAGLFKTAKDKEKCSPFSTTMTPKHKSKLTRKASEGED